MLTASGRQGFTLTELMLSVVLTLIVTGSTYSLLLTSQRLTRAQAQRIALQSSVRAGAFIVMNELAELGSVTGGTPDQNDLITMGGSAVTYRALRGTGFVCHTAGASVIQLARSSFSAHRDPQPGRDEAYVFVPGSSANEAKDSWVPAKIVSVTTANVCPGGAGPAITLGLASSPSLVPVEAGTPVRITEIMELRAYHSDGGHWLGARSIDTGETLQPLLGPLADIAGFQLEYLDGAGAPTLDRTAVKSIRVRLRGRVQSNGSLSATAGEEELISQVALRNSLEPW